MDRPSLAAIRELVAVALLASGGLFVAGCASTRVEAEWSDPQFAGRSLRGAKVLVVCDAAEIVAKRICQDKLAAQLTASGATPVIGPEDLTVGPAPGNDRSLAAARGAGATAILGAVVTRDASVVGGGSSVGFSIGGFGGSGGGGGVGVGVGVGVPVGGPQVDTAYGANMTLTDVATVRLMWTSKVTAPAAQDLGAQIGELARVGVEAAQKAGFF
jgi:hypothetical protein